MMRRARWNRRDRRLWGLGLPLWLRSEYAVVVVEGYKDPSLIFHRSFEFMSSWTANPAPPSGARARIWWSTTLYGSSGSRLYR